VPSQLFVSENQRVASGKDGKQKSSNSGKHAKASGGPGSRKGSNSRNLTDALFDLVQQNQALMDVAKIKRNEGPSSSESLRNLQAEDALSAYERVRDIDHSSTIPVSYGSRPFSDGERLAMLSELNSLEHVIVEELKPENWANYSVSLGGTGWLLNNHQDISISVQICLVPYNAYMVQDDRGHLELEEAARDRVVIEMQPVVKAIYPRGYVLSPCDICISSKSIRLFGNLISVPSSNTFISHEWTERPIFWDSMARLFKNTNTDRLRRSFMPCDSASVPTSVFEDPDVVDKLGGFVAFSPLFISAYQLKELYQRRTILPPGLDRATSVMRLLRIASEDMCTNSFLSDRVENRKILSDTVNVMVGFLFSDMTTPLQSF